MAHVVSVRLATETIFSEAIEFSSVGETTVRLADGGLVLDGTEVTFTLRSGTSRLASFEVPPPSGLDDDEWTTMPGARGHDRISLAVDVPGFTVCFDASAATSSSRSTVLKAIRLVRQRTAQPVVAIGDELEEISCDDTVAGVGDDDVLDAGDAPVIARSAHGEWLRSAPRPGPPVKCWSKEWLAQPDADVAALRRDACALVAHGLGGRTFWIGRGDEPRCPLERLAREISSMHEAHAVAAVTEDATHAMDTEVQERFLGSEWWVQMRSVEPPRASANDDGASIAFHVCDGLARNH